MQETPQTIVFSPPIELMADIEMPSRSNMKKVGDMVRIILADEEAIQAKNADLKALRSYAEKIRAMGAPQ